MEELDIATIRKRSVHGVVAVVTRQQLAGLISFGTSLIIYTQLVASDVGIYTAVTAIHRIISFFTDLGLGAALVQKKDMLTEEDITTSFTIQAGITFTIFIVIFLLQGYISHFFKLNPSADRLLIALVFTIFLSSFKIIPSILLEREIEFSKLAIPQIVESISFNLVLVFFVMKGYKIDSYTIAFLVSGIISIPVYYAVAPWKIRFGFHKEAFRHLRYGAQFQLKNILATVKDDLLTVILTKFLTFRDIGYIGFAQRNAFQVFRSIVDPVTKVSFSTYARLQESAEYMRKTIEKSLFMVSSFVFPVLAGLIVTSPYIIHYFPKWHNKWEPAIFSLIFFCLNAGISALSNILITVLDANGRVKTTLRMMIAWTVLTWILTPLCITFFGYNGVAIASFLVTLTLFVTVYLVKQIVVFSVWSNIYKPLLSTVIMALVVYYYSAYFTHSLFNVGESIVLGGIVYIGTFYLTAKQEINENISIIMKRGVK